MKLRLAKKIINGRSAFSYDRYHKEVAIKRLQKSKRYSIENVEDQEKEMRKLIREFVGIKDDNPIMKSFSLFARFFM